MTSGASSGPSSSGASSTVGIGVGGGEDGHLEGGQRCTALDSRDDWAALVVTPPCTCPRCAPEDVYRPSPVDDGWLRRSGSSQRLRVARFELGATGHAVLG